MNSFQMNHMLLNGHHVKGHGHGLLDLRHLLSYLFLFSEIKLVFNDHRSFKPGD